MAGTATSETAGEHALKRLRSSVPAEWLAPNPELSKTARLASEYLFSRLKPYAVKCPFDRLLTDGFDSEQIWQQIDLQTQPLLSTFRREIKKFERNPEEIKKLRPIVGLEEDVKVREQDGEGEEKKQEDNDFDGDYGDDMDMDDIEAFEEDDDEDEDDDDDDDEEEEKGGREREEEKREEREGGVEDKFLKINELEKFLHEDEAREYDSKSNEKRGRGEEDEDDDSDVNYEEVNL